jgi:phage gpG-like protein
MPVGFSFPGVKSGVTGNAQMGIEIRPMPLILVGQFGAFAESVRTFRVPLERSVKQVVIPSIRENFDVSGRPAWPGLSAFTEARRTYLGFGAGVGAEILVRKGKLKRSATAFARWSFDKQTAWVGNDFPQDAWYGPAQQNGFVGGYGAETPSRPFMLIQDQDQPKIEAIFIKWFEERAVATGAFPA